MFLVDAAHERSCGRQDLVDEDEDRFLGAELDTLADHVDELSDSQVGWDEVFLLVDSGDVRLFDFFADHLQPSEEKVSDEEKIPMEEGREDIEEEGEGLAYGDAISVFLTDAFSFCLALFERVLVLEFGAHGD